MRAVAAAGVLRLLARWNLIDSFDTFHGSSSGACSVSYLFTNQFEVGRQIYDYIGTREIVNPFRFLAQPCMVNTDYIVDDIIGHILPLDTDRITAEPGVLNIVTTSINHCTPIIHNHFKNRNDVLRALKATLRVPGPFEKGIDIGNTKHLDGGILAPVPVFSAITAGATHILIVSTQRVHDYTTRGYFRNHIEGHLLKLLYGQRMKAAYLKAQYVNRPSWNHDCSDSVQFDILIRPASATYCGWSTIEKATLTRVEKESEHIAAKYLDPDSWNNNLQTKLLAEKLEIAK
jgi:predicted patatin/cPLA2 family phospholipase